MTYPVDLGILHKQHLPLPLIGVLLRLRLLRTVLFFFHAQLPPQLRHLFNVATQASAQRAADCLMEGAPNGRRLCLSSGFEPISASECDRDLNESASLP